MAAIGQLKGTFAVLLLFSVKFGGPGLLQNRQIEI
jgi:hypothetical protein